MVDPVLPLSTSFDWSALLAKFEGDICATRLHAQAESAELAARKALPAATGQLGELADSLQVLLAELQSVATTGP